MPYLGEFDCEPDFDSLKREIYFQNHRQLLSTSIIVQGQDTYLESHPDHDQNLHTLFREQYRFSPDRNLDTNTIFLRYAKDYNTNFRKFATIRGIASVVGGWFCGLTKCPAERGKKWGRCSGRLADDTANRVASVPKIIILRIEITTSHKLKVVRLNS